MGGDGGKGDDAKECRPDKGKGKAGSADDEGQEDEDDLDLGADFDDNSSEDEDYESESKSSEEEYEPEEEDQLAGDNETIPNVQDNFSNKHRNIHANKARKLAHKERPRIVSACGW